MNSLKIDKNGIPLMSYKYIGKKCGKLEIIKYSHFVKQKNGSLRHYFICKCECGVEKRIALSSLIALSTISCGCYSSKLKSERFSKHGLSRSRIYAGYYAMISRCYDKKNKKYKIYGAKGVIVCERWRCQNGFINFSKDMGDKPKGYTLDRIKSDMNYSCGECSECKNNGWEFNCRWATFEVQNNNTNRNKFIEYDGERMTITQMAKNKKIPERGLFYRIKSGWTIDDAINIPFDVNVHKPNKNILVNVNGKELSLAQAERQLGYTRGILSGRLKKGWSKEDAVNILPALSNKKRKFK